MNIAVLKPSGRYCFRPDTTLNREACDYYLPDGIEEVTLTPCIYSKVIKAGKCISARFAGRHIDNFGFGVLLDAAGSDPQEASCMDGTSYISGDTLPLGEAAGRAFDVCINGEPWFIKDDFEESLLAEAVVTVSRRSSLRATDIVAVSLPASISLRKGDWFSFCGKKVNIL